MKIRILETVMLRGLPQEPGAVVEVTEREGVSIVSVGRGAWFSEVQSPESKVQSPESKVEVREPLAETRDPKPAKARRNRRE